jgi:hypothetical protein
MLNLSWYIYYIKYFMFITMGPCSLSDDDNHDKFGQILMKFIVNYVVVPMLWRSDVTLSSMSHIPMKKGHGCFRVYMQYWVLLICTDFGEAVLHIILCQSRMLLQQSRIHRKPPASEKKEKLRLISIHVLIWLKLYHIHPYIYIY